MCNSSWAGDGSELTLLCSMDVNVLGHHHRGPWRAPSTWDLPRRSGSSWHGPFTWRIDDYTIPKSFEKLPILNMFDDMGDFDEHLDYFDLMLCYRGARDVVKWNIFPLILSKEALAWFCGSRMNSISSWNQLAELFPTQFTASRSKPKSAKGLNVVWQGEYETLRECVERFNNDVVYVRDLNNKMRL